MPRNPQSVKLGGEMCPTRGYVERLTKGGHNCLHRNRSWLEFGLYNSLVFYFYKISIFILNNHYVKMFILFLFICYLIIN